MKIIIQGSKYNLNIVNGIQNNSLEEIDIEINHFTKNIKITKIKCLEIWQKLQKGV